MQRNSDSRSSTKSRSMMMSIPTLGDSVNFTAEKSGKLLAALLIITSNLVDKNEPPPRAIKIQGQANLKIDFDIDVGLLMTSIPSRDAVDEEQITWDWEQQFSQLTAEFLSRV